MTTFTLWLIMMGLGPAYGDNENWVERGVRLWVVAGAIDDASVECDYPGSVSELRAALVATGYYESRFSRRIHEGDCLPHECDRGKAVGLWQTWSLWFDVEQSRGVGTDADATFISARAAAQALADGRRNCASLRGALSWYATGNSCRWSGARKRHRMARWLRWIL